MYCGLFLSIVHRESKKASTIWFAHNFAKCWSIFFQEVCNKIFVIFPATLKLCSYTTLGNVQNQRWWNSDIFNTITSNYCNFHQTNTLKCTYVWSAVKLNTKKSSFHMNTHSETFTPLVFSVIDDALLKSHASHAIVWVRSRYKFSEVGLLRNFYANFVSHWFQIWVLEPQAWWNGRGCLPFQISEMEDIGTEAVRAHWADTLFLLENKKAITDLSHMTGSCCRVRSML